jgi:hypothetical protein
VRLTGGAPHATLTLGASGEPTEPSPVVDTDIYPLFAASKPTVALGAIFVTRPTSGWRIRFDNLLFVGF